MSEQIITKQCTKCKEVKPFSKFNICTNNPFGYQAYCKVCQKQYSKQHLQTERGRELHRQNSARRRCSLKGQEYHRKYNRSKNARQSYKSYCIQNPEKRKAKDAVNNAILRNGMPPASNYKCNCGEQAKQYHHPSYAPINWFKVIPLCINCHKKRHRKPLQLIL